MGWLRLVGSLKLQVSFAEYHLLHRALLQKSPKILRSLLTVATSYAYCVCRYMYVYMHVCISVWMYVCMQACMFVCSFWCVGVCMHASTYLSMRACMDVGVCVCMYTFVCVYICPHLPRRSHGVATISRLLKIIGLFCRISSLS